MGQKKILTCCFIGFDIYFTQWLFLLELHQLSAKLIVAESHDHGWQNHRRGYFILGLVILDKDLKRILLNKEYFRFNKYLKNIREK